MAAQIANAQAAEQYVPPTDGVYMELPLSGILWFNSHSFNLTEADTFLDARVNWFYAHRQAGTRRPARADRQPSIVPLAQPRCELLGAR